MNTPSPSARAYRRLGYLALAHAVALLALAPFFLASRGTDEPGFWLLPLWVGLVTLWFFWPVVLALHHGRSALRFGVFISIAAVLLLPSLRFYCLEAPWTFGFPPGVTLNPLGTWQYLSAYRAGRAEAQKDVAAGILAIEEYGLGAGSGYHAQILRERYHIEVRPTAQCLVNERILGHAAGYNAVSEREIDHRIGRSTVEAARDEGYKLDVEQRARQEQYSKDLAKRLSSFPSDSKIALESVQPWTDGRREIGAEAEQELAQVVRAVEKFIVKVIPPDAPAFELRMSGELKPTEPPRFEGERLSASLSCPRPVYEKIYNGLPNLPLPQWKGGMLSVGLDFAVRETH